jgi:CubicO group peptidase (beta-lactamase class C family)
MYAALANDGRIDGKQFLSAELARGLTGTPRVVPDRNVVVPMPFHLGYHESPIPGLLKGFGHIGLGGMLGWADPETRSAFAYIHNRLVTPMLFDSASFAVLVRPLRTAITAARTSGAHTVPEFGAPFPKPARKPPVGKKAGRGGRLASRLLGRVAQSALDTSKESSHTSRS